MIGRQTLKVAIGPRTTGANGPARRGRPRESLMRKAAAAVAASVFGVGVLAASSAPVLASGGAATPFKVEYSGDGAEYDCSGARIVNRVSVKDSETCLLTGDTSWVYAGSFSGDPFLYGPGCSPSPCLWGSDYDGQVATSWSVTVVDNGDGTFTIYLVAYF